MAENPYIPPEAKVEDTGGGPVLAVRPRRVVLAVQMLWISLFLSLPAIYWEAGRSPEGFTAGVFIFSGVLVGIAAWLNVKLWHGVNWARILYLVLAVLSIGTLMATGSEMLETSVPEFLVSAVGSVLDAVAMVLLFTGRAPLWFRRTPG